MSERLGDEGERPVERGGGEEASGTPLTPAEEKNSLRPAGVTPGATPSSAPGVTPGSVAGDDRGDDTGADEVSDEVYERTKELNPDDFE
ncbi:hypothetical protein FHS43_001479 [Streptosporangium becharense]|uniref:Uncharacterized protein n=1 Tax=Streptosporangium becharense TaxID=1816182 RepID=A0A7W9MJY6_9ACTN|nr:hypothetical protein [Streptosporangium becharense]MBB2910216.1 hypothetical protein [Streptosporangium becharense]MBB5822959.1 hypothetical protein [Streptosporangium becharense]